MVFHCAELTEPNQ